MIMTIAAKKGKGLDDLLQSLTPQLPDTTKKVIFSESVFNILHDKFRQVLNEHEQKKYIAPYFFGLGITEILTPENINRFIQTTIQHEHHPYYQATVGRVASRLIEKSYEAGTTRFYLDLRNLKAPHYLINNIYADYRRKLEVTIDGDVGSDFAVHSVNLNVTLHGNIGESGAQFLQESSITLDGEIKGYNFGFGGKHLVVKSSNEKTLMDVIQIGIELPVSEVAISHVYLIKPDGTEQLVRYRNRIFPWKD